MGVMIGRRIALGVAGGLGCFALGLAAARLLGQAPAPAPPPSPPRIVIDPASIQLLPDASLRLDLPHGFGDAGL
jgi:hypothetical protein